MKKNQYLKKLSGVVLMAFTLLGTPSIRHWVDTANAADEVLLKATDLERINPGTEAPDFNLESEDKSWVKLSSYQNHKNVVLIFYRGYW